ncbi:amino acid ABC transporter substrate-binding protein [Carnobacterium gallinarum]|uniref:amino acid ABC transporter substrate-binding protein n=1 Tax=Carnobacterium gallinarum TaxID=2749 RepID=UPI000551AC30|nr:amino acid ABC transporter substrate-binding protein [Carnobacterium gallinarum]
MKKKLIWISLLLLAVIIGGCSSQPVAKEKGKEKVIIGLDDTFVPMGYRDSNGKIVGFDVDLANEFGKRMNMEIEFQPIDWSMKETELNSGNIDLIWNGYAKNAEREEKVNFSQTYLEVGQVIIVLKDSPIQTKADLKGKTVAAQQSSSAVSILAKDAPDLLKSFKGGEMITYASNNDVFNDLDSGRSEAIIVGGTYGRYTIKQKGAEKYRILKDDFGVEEVAVGVRKKDTALLKKVNQALTEMKEDGTQEKIKAKWFSE